MVEVGGGGLLEHWGNNQVCMVLCLLPWEGVVCAVALTFLYGGCHLLVTSRHCTCIEASRTELSHWARRGRFTN